MMIELTHRGKLLQKRQECQVPGESRLNEPATGCTVPR